MRTIVILWASANAAVLVVTAAVTAIEDALAIWRLRREIDRDLAELLGGAA